MGHAPEILERSAVSFQKRLRALPRKGLHEDGPRIRERHHEQGDLCLLSGQTDRRFAKVDLRLSGRVRERQKDFLLTLFPGPDGVLHHRLAAGVALLISQPLEDPMRRVPLLLRCLTVVLQNLEDHRQERF